jgi:hypothetical protein
MHVKIQQPLVKLLMVFLLQCLLVYSVEAQTKTVTGKVTDATTGLPLSGATISAKGASAFST